MWWVPARSGVCSLFVHGALKTRGRKAVHAQRHPQRPRSQPPNKPPPPTPQKVEMVGRELELAVDLFEEQGREPPLAPGTAPFSGAVAWLRGIRGRCQGITLGLRSLPPAVLSGRPARKVQAAADGLLAALLAAETAWLRGWEEVVHATSSSSLAQPLLRCAWLGGGQH
jgi:Dynein heavy chain, N-terminal region 1